jgi:hypothetical protein
VELTFIALAGLALVLVIIFVGLSVFAWLAHTLFGVSEHWLDYGIEEDELG